jgi:hypothetical protein
MKRSEIKQLLEKENLPMSNISSDYVGDSIVKDYIEKYKDWHIGDKVKLSISKEDLSEEIRNDYTNDDEFEDDWVKYENLFGKELIIDDFYNVGAIFIQDFDFGMEIKWFEKV